MGKKYVLNYEKYVVLFIVTLLYSVKIFSQHATNIEITGVVRSDSSILAGVTIVLKETGKVIGITDSKGGFKINAPTNGILIFSSIGYTKLEQPIAGNPVLNIILVSENNSLNDVVLVGYGQQKKESIVGAITSINPKEIKGPTSNLTTMLAGRVAGMIAYQRSGEPGRDNASFFIRGLGSFGSGKVDPLIMIDGVESSTNDLARLQPDDIEGFSVLKDASSTAVYGARAANGVVLVTTKSGVAGKTKFNGRIENSISTNTENFKFANNITYMELANEAATTRDALGQLPYSQVKIDHTKARDNPLLYPNNNWIDQLISDYTMNQRYNINISGGADKAKYYLSGTYNIDNGILKQEKLNGFNNNIKLKNYAVRSKVDLKFTKTTNVQVMVYAQFDDYNGPVGARQTDGTIANGGTTIFNEAIWSNPVMFPAIYPSSYLPYIHHPLFGNAIIPGTTSTLYQNPFADMVKGHSEYNSSTVQAQIDLKQDLNWILPGLNFNAMSYVERYGYFDVTRQYNPFYYTPSTLDGKTIDQLLVLNGGGIGSVGTTGTEYLDYSEGNKIVNSTFYAQASVNYNHTFNNVHNVSGMVIGTMRNYNTGNAGTLEASLPQRNLGVSGRASYTYDRRYLLEFDFGYNGSEKFASDNRFGFFPSIGFAWNVSNEKFLKDNKVLNNLKLRGTYGIVGNDQIGSSDDRFFYMSNVNMNNATYASTFGTDYGYTVNGISISRYANNNITWEKSKQADLGLDATLFKDLNITVDAYNYNRSNILMARSYIPSTMGLEAGVSANVGKANSKGIDASLQYNKTISNSWWIQSRANFTYATSKVTVYDEPDYGSQNLAYLSHVGNSTSQVYGYIAERLFVDDNEVANSPKQTFGEYMGGDIKYRDINGDGQITTNDVVPIGYPTTPEINYGFGFSVGYKNFDFSMFFEGIGRTSFWINPQNISPFVLNGSSQNELLKTVADSHWSENNQNVYAFWPRLSSYYIDNNNQTSTWWMRNGAFLRLKSAEFGYTLPSKMLTKIGFNTGRIYVNGSNLFLLSKFKMWDPEMGGNGLGYPLQRVFNIGLNFGL
ncbi:MAG: TonB-dependent receptor [Arachidicoccus sp.]|nr:TonB-dependent receptor [Arachidicoccus sp.]